MTLIHCRAAMRLSLAATLAAYPLRASSQITPRPGISAIIDAFKTHDVVLLGELHWMVEQHRFIQQLLRDPRLSVAVNDIAVEFGNSRYQSLIDRYIAGKSVPFDSLALVWRNTTVPLAWDPPIYADFYRTVREVNRGLPIARRMRVVALDPPIEWDSLTRAEQFPRAWGYRDPIWFEVLEREVLSKRRKVLVIAGALHILRRDPPDFLPKPIDRAGLGDALAQSGSTRVYSVYPVLGRGSLASLTPWPAGTLADVAGTSIGAHSSSVLWPSSVTMFRTINGKRQPYTLASSDFPPIETLVDALLFYGTDTSATTLPAPLYSDCKYVAELRRRNDLVLSIFGMDQRAVIDSLSLEASKRHRDAHHTC